MKESEERYVLQTMKDIPYGKWREYNPEDTTRFYALRMRDTGIIKSNPRQFIDQHADWSYLKDLKKRIQDNKVVELSEVMTNLIVYWILP